MKSICGIFIIIFFILFMYNRIKEEDSYYKVSLSWLGAIAVLSYIAAIQLIPLIYDLLVANNMWGYDMSKFVDPTKERTKVPEALGLVSATVYIIGVSFLVVFFQSSMTEFNAALVTIACVSLLGFVDDVIDLRWSIKICISTWSTLPLLVSYIAQDGSTNVIVPLPLRSFFGLDIDLGFLYLVYMMLWMVFCTNAINIYAGVNGLESGQTVVIAMAILLHNIVECSFDDSPYFDYHYFSFFMVLPFLSVSLALFYYNQYPSQCFVGDTFTYFAGVTLAVSGILGHFSKTLMLFFLPQLFNFFLSVPQLFRWIPCPRHRLPKFLPESNTMTYSKNENGQMNLTLINLWLYLFGDKNEGRLTLELLLFQVVSCGFGFFIRYVVASYFF